MQMCEHCDLVHREKEERSFIEQKKEGERKTGRANSTFSVFLLLTEFHFPFLLEVTCSQILLHGFKCYSKVPADNC
jgi:hypothetical protein